MHVVVILLSQQQQESKLDGFMCGTFASCAANVHMYVHIYTVNAMHFVALVAARIIHLSGAIIY